MGLSISCLVTFCQRRPWSTLIAGLAMLAPVGAWSADKDSVSVAAPWHISNLEPSENGYTLLRMEVGETLVDSGVDGGLRPGLATAWSVSDDGRVWTFILRQGVRFHDGSALSADVVVASLERGRIPLRRSRMRDHKTALPSRTR